MINLWDHQRKAHAEIIQAFKRNLKPVLVMPTGAGKSITMTSFIAHYPFYNFVMIVRTRGLVYQLEEDLKKFKLDYALYMAGEKVDLSKKIQLCSKDTLDARDMLPFLGKENTVVIYDEADEGKDFQKEIIFKYQNASSRFFYVGQTATPYNGLDQFDLALTPITAKELNEQGILVNYLYFIPKLQDYSEVKIIRGEFVKNQLMKKFNSPSGIAESFKNWLEFGDNRQTLIFNINVEHSKRTVNYINSYYNREVAVHVDADTGRDQRKLAIRKFESGEYKFLSNVRLFTRGTDIPIIGCILDQAPTLSTNLHIQKLGRGSRKNPVYKDCIIVDVANNLLNNGHFYQEREINLNDAGNKTKKDLGLQMKRCAKCFKGYVGDHICPYCNHENEKPKPKKLSKAAKEKLFMESASPEMIEQRQMIKDFKKKLWILQNIQKKSKDIARRDAIFYIIKTFGFEKTLKIKRSIGLSDEHIREWNRKNEYTPLGGKPIPS